MSTVEPQPPSTGPPAKPAEKHRNPWVWVSVVLALLAVGLLIWALTTRSDLNSSEDEVSALQTQVSSESAESDAAQELADDLAQDLGSTSEDLAATEQQLEQAEQSANQAEKDAAAAKQDADQAKNATEKAAAEAEEAQAQVDAAESKTAIVGECARAYVTALGSLFEGDDPNAQAEVVRGELQSISEQCQAALAG